MYFVVDLSPFCLSFCLFLSFSPFVFKFSFSAAWCAPCRYATAVNAEKPATTDKIRTTVAQLGEKMKTDKKFNSGNIRELEEAMEARKNASPVGGISVSKRDRFAKTGSGQT
jgi:hypothetical protein